MIKQASVAAAAARRISPLRNPWNFNDWLVYRRKYTSVVLSNVYPDVSASAACVRTNSIVHGLARMKGRGESEYNRKTVDDDDANNNRVYYATSVDVSSDEKKGKNPFANDRDNPSSEESKCSNSSNSQGTIRMVHLPPNRSDLAEEHFWMETTESSEPPRSTKTTNVNDRNNIDLVIFDRFFVEEAHSFRFRNAFPNAALVLDMQDMHSLRWGRQAIVEDWDKQQTNSNSSHWDPLGCLPRVMEYLPTVNARDERFVRELASIHRSDLVLVCSPQELHWLQTVYKLPNEKLLLASFFLQQHALNQLPLPTSDATPPRFVFCGGFKHAPNADAVQLLIDFVWPRIRLELPDASLHIYGAFCPEKLLQVDNKEGIFVHGYEPKLSTIFGDGILLAPLRFGAGIKGKIVDAWTFGMPVVTTPIGSEGMTGSIHDSDDNDNNTQAEAGFGGSIASTLDEFCNHAIHLARRPEAYRQAQIRGRFLLKKLFDADENWNHVQERLLEMMDKEYLSRQRQTDYTQAMLWHQSLRSTEYFSRWVELKERIARDARDQK
mmetsp:Transcript_17571/g.43833  ORF Transcript_17571/g.43833 Transcript_17571/m.43833 type:complete len:550 (-) Transcript_17571:1259-2908(-)